MASFKPLSVGFNPQTPDTLFTQIEFTFDDTRKSIITVQHFRAKDVQEMTDNIVAAGKGEWKRLLAADQSALNVTGLQQYINNSYGFSQT